VAVVWKVGAKQFKHLATFAKLFEVVEGFGGAEQCLLCGIRVEVGEARVGESGVELLGFKKGKRFVALDDLNQIRCSWLAERIRIPVSVIDHALLLP
jgi:hypothetical protein